MAAVFFGSPPTQRPQVLVLKHGALGDFFFALGAMKHIADAHHDAHRVLLTTAAFVPLAEKTGYFHEVLIDERPPLTAFSALLKLGRWATARSFHRVYDLQNVTRTRAYMWVLFSPRIWNGETPYARFPYSPPRPFPPHQLERKRQQLAKAGLPGAPDPDLSFLKGDLEELNLPTSFFLLVPGASKGGSFKKWPAFFYGQLAQKLAAHGVTPVIVGSKLDQPEADVIQAHCPEALNLCGRTTWDHLASLGRHARGVLGNDTGPFHILWLAGCPAVGLFSGRSDPANCGPLSPGSCTLRADSIQALPLEDVWKAVSTVCGF